MRTKTPVTTVFTAAVFFLLSIFIPPFQEVFAKLPDNNPLPESRSALLLAGGDLVIETLTTHAVILPGQPVWISITLKNAGDQNIVNGYKAFGYVNPASWPPNESTPSSSQFEWYMGMEPSETVLWEFTHTFSTTGCDHKIFVWVDRDNTVVETDEGNNTASFNVCVGYSASGTVLDSRNRPIEGVVVSTASGESATTNSSGGFTLKGLGPGNHMVSAAKAGYTFAPAAQNVAVPPNAPSVNFVGTQVTYSISGLIIGADQQPISGVIVSLGPGVSAISGANGVYTFDGLTEGSYTVTPSKTGYSFTPSSRTVALPPAQTNANFSGAPSGGQNRKWTFLLYLAGDSNLGPLMANVLHQIDPNTNAAVNVVALFDGNATFDSVRVFYKPDMDSEFAGEKKMDDPASLIDFVLWAKEKYPAENYYLVISDHANGIKGIAQDYTSDSKGTAFLTPRELRDALATITGNGTDPIDVLHFDGCSFGLLENAYLARGYVDFLVYSQNTGWSRFAYKSYLDQTTANTTPRELAVIAADTYATQMTNRGNPAAQYPYTISTLDMSRIDPVLLALKTFSSSLINWVGSDTSKRHQIDNLRSASQKFDSSSPIFAITNQDAYVDLVDFASQVKNQNLSTQVTTSATGLIEAVRGNQPFVIYESHKTGSFSIGGEEFTYELPRASGVSIYYPPVASGKDYLEYQKQIDDGQGKALYPGLNSQSFWLDYLNAVLNPPAFGEEVDELPLLPLLLFDFRMYLPLLTR